RSRSMSPYWPWQSRVSRVGSSPWVRSSGAKSWDTATCGVWPGLVTCSPARATKRATRSSPATRLPASTKILPDRPSATVTCLSSVSTGSTSPRDLCERTVTGCGAEQMTRYWCEAAWLGDRVAERVLVEVAGDRIAAVHCGVSRPDGAVRLAGLTLPGLA